MKESATFTEGCLQQLLEDATFRTSGVMSGRDGLCVWTIIDPVQHPLFVWRKEGRGPFAYARTAQCLDAIAFSNGPMMGKRCAPGWKVGRGVAAVELVAWPISMGAMGVVLARRAQFRRALALLGGGLLGASIAWRRLFTGWIPCGMVRSTAAGIQDIRDFDREGARHAWFGRRGLGFETYAIEQGDLPDDVLEGAGGLLLLVRDYAVPSTRAGDPTYDSDFAELRHKRGYIGWGLIPLPRVGPATGVLAIIGSLEENAEVAAERMCRLGARDAVLTDQRTMVMLGVEGRLTIGPPGPHRQTIQTYGFYCA